MAPYVGLAVAVVGGLAGSLLALPAYRWSVPSGTRVRRICGTCRQRFPAGSAGWLRWAGTCPHCGTRLGPPAWLLAGICAALCGGLGWRFGWSPVLLPYLLFAVSGLLLAAVDVARLRLPDLLLLPTTGAVVVLFTVVAAALSAGPALTRALLAGLACGLAFFLLALVPGARLGLGDVKLAVLLGVCLGWLGWPAVIAGALLGFLVNAPVALALLLVRRVDRRADLPFGPAMMAGAYLAIVGLPALSALLSR